MQITDALFVVVVIIFSAIIHEVMHGYVADLLGDQTARYAGRLTLNPISHIDPFGSVILPLILVLSQSPIFFGYAKPVPYNPYNLRPGRFSEAFVAGAGPFANLALALLGGLLIRTGVLGGAGDIAFIVVQVNVMLCLFNLIPIPPLDGSKVLGALLPRSLSYGYVGWCRRMEANPMVGMMLVVLMIFVLGGVWSHFLFTIASKIAGA